MDRRSSLTIQCSTIYSGKYFRRMHGLVTIFHKISILGRKVESINLLISPTPHPVALVILDVSNSTICNSVFFFFDMTQTESVNLPKVIMAIILKIECMFKKLIWMKNDQGNSKHIDCQQRNTSVNKSVVCIHPLPCTQEKSQVGLERQWFNSVADSDSDLDFTFLRGWPPP